MNSVTERPILFSAPMVRAILAGTKTQTRRAMRIQPRPFRGGASVSDGIAYWDGGASDSGCCCPYGKPGDRLWVRETHYRWGGSGTDKSVIYLADGEWIDWGMDPVWRGKCDLKNYFGKKRPAIHMPRWATRLTLEVTNIRVERLNAITLDDARAEGVASKGEYALLWDEINGGGAYMLNPWVWVVDFKRIP